jgi:GAF domain-containing protein
LAGKIGMNPFALSPLVFRGETIGVLGIDRSGTNGAITEDEFRMLKLFADQAAIMISVMGNPLTDPEDSRSAKP